MCSYCMRFNTNMIHMIIPTPFLMRFMMFNACHRIITKQITSYLYIYIFIMCSVSFAIFAS